LNALHLATINGNVEVVQALMKRNVDINSRDKLYAVSTMVVFSIQQLVFSNLFGHRGASALDYALHVEHDDIVKILRQHGVRCGSTSVSGCSKSVC
jgi:ankyrin repeat protein